MQLKEFQTGVGEIIMYCQCIEHDMKWIYAGLINESYIENFNAVEKFTLGQVVKEIRDKDYLDNMRWFSKDDYKLLSEVIGIRNYWAHHAFRDFVYEGLKSEEYKKVFDRLLNDKNKLSKISQVVEKLRVKIFTNGI